MFMWIYFAIYYQNKNVIVNKIYFRRTIKKSCVFSWLRFYCVNAPGFAAATTRRGGSGREYRAKGQRHKGGKTCGCLVVIKLPKPRWRGRQKTACGAVPGNLVATIQFFWLFPLAMMICSVTYSPDRESTAQPPEQE